MEEMKALVEPFPFVPAMCIGFSRSNSEGWKMVSRDMETMFGTAHLIANLVAPFNHLWYSLLIHALARLPYRVDNGEIGLQGVECCHRCLAEC